MAICTVYTVWLFFALAALAPAQIVVIQGSDTLTASRTTINNNFSFLASSKTARWTGSGAPGSIPLSIQGDLYFDTVGQHTYACYSVLCSASPTWTRVDGIVTAPGSSGQLIYNLSGAFAAFTLAGDCSISIPNVTCTSTGGVAFAASATTNALNATNISSGTLAKARTLATTVYTDQNNTLGAFKWDGSGAAHTLPAIVVATVGALPSTGCVAGELGVVTGATLGQQIYENSGTGSCTWTQQLNSGGAGGAPFPSTTVTSNIATYGANCPCILKNGSVLHTLASSFTVGSTVGTGDIWAYTDKDGLVSVGYPAGITSISISGATGVTPITQFPFGSIPISDWHVTTNNFDVSETIHGNAGGSGPWVPVASATVVPTCTGNSCSFAATGGAVPSGFYLVNGPTSYCGATLQVCTPASGLTILTTPGSSTVNSSGGTQVIQAKAVTGTNMILAGQAIAGGNTSLTVAVLCNPFPSANNGAPFCGLGARESGTGKIIALFSTFLNSSSNAGAGTTLAAFTSQTSAATNVSTNNYTRMGAAIWWGKITCSVAGCATGNITFSMSPDGVNFSQGYTEAVTAHFTTAPNQWGAIGSSDSTDNDLYTDIMSFLVQ